MKSVILTTLLIAALMLAAATCRSETLLTWPENPASDNVRVYQVWQCTGTNQLFEYIGESTSNAFVLPALTNSVYKFVIVASNDSTVSASSPITEVRVPSAPGKARVITTTTTITTRTVTANP